MNVLRAADRLLGEAVRSHRRGVFLGGSVPVEYRDPERERALLRDPGGRDRAEPRHDVYTVGARVYAMIEGGPPPCGARSPFTRPVPEDLAFVVHRAMAEGDARYPDPASMRRDVRALLAGRRLRSPRPAAPARTLRPYPVVARRYRRGSRLFALGCAALVLVAFLALRAPTAAEPTGLSGVVAGLRSVLDERLRAAGEDASGVGLLVVDDVGRGFESDWPRRSGQALRVAARAALHAGGDAGTLQRVLLQGDPGGSVPAVLWIRSDEVTLMYRGLTLRRSCPGTR